LDPFLHYWVVTRYEDVVRVLREFSAARTPTPEQLTSIGLSKLNPLAQVMVKQMLFLDPPSHTRIRAWHRQLLRPVASRRSGRISETLPGGLIQATAANGRMNIIAELAEPLPCIVTAEMLGCRSKIIRS